MVTVSDLRAYIGVGASVTDEQLQADLDAAFALIAATVGEAYVPEVVLNEVTLGVGYEMWSRRAAPSGLTQFASVDGNPARMYRDPLTAYYPILSRYLLSGV